MQNIILFTKDMNIRSDIRKKSLEADYVIVAMSGDYVQRGTPALHRQTCPGRHGSAVWG